MSIGARIADRLEALGGRADGFSQAWLARRTGLTQPTINSLIRNPGAGSRHLAKIASALQTSVPYLLGEIDDPAADIPKLSIESTKHFLGITMIKELGEDLRLSLGGGADVPEVPYERRVPFRTAWLREVTSAGPDDVFLASGQGDSMFPTILSGDHVLIERTSDEIDRQDAIWAVVYADLIMLKRVRRLPDGDYELRSDNAAVGFVKATRDEIRVIGRVIWIGRRV
jgi:phage repressor protein C with HTH and peptisase S24 domain